MDDLWEALAQTILDLRTRVEKLEKHGRRTKKSSRGGDKHGAKVMQKRQKRGNQGER